MDLMKNTKVAIGALVISFACLFTGCAKLPNDGANTKKYHLADMNRVRYLEVFVVGGNGITGNLIANVYNTSLVPDRDPSVKDTAPDAWAQSLNTDEIEEHFGALGAAINGPKLWMLDWVDIPLGASQRFNGKNIPWCAELHLTKTELKEMGKFAYKPTTIARKSAFGYNKGSTVFLIDDADGTTWVMKGFELGLKPRWTYEEFAADPASKFRQLPAGWKFRTKVLDQDLILVPETGIATIMPDEFFNVYDKTGPAYSNYKP